MSTAADRMYCILRQLCDPEYLCDPDKEGAPTKDDMVDAVIAYEIEKRGDIVGWEVPEPGLYKDWHVLTMRVAYGTPDIRGARFRDCTMSFRYKDELTHAVIRHRFEKTYDLTLEEMKQHGWLK